MSNADELIKLKELLDSGVLTQEEFDIEKEKLLNQDSNTESTSEEESVENLQEATIDEKTGEPACPYCGGTNIKTSKEIGVNFKHSKGSVVGLRWTNYDEVKCNTCGKTYWKNIKEKR